MYIFFFNIEPIVANVEINKNMDSFVLIKIFKFLSVENYLSLSLVCTNFSNCVREIIIHNSQFNVIHHLNKLQEDLVQLISLTSDKRLFLSTYNKCDKMLEKSKSDIKLVKKNLHIHRKYNKHFYNRENELIFTLENHDLSKFYPNWKCITHPIDINLYQKSNKKWKVVFSFDHYIDQPDSLLEHFFGCDLDGFANVDYIGENMRNLAKPKYLEVIEECYSVRGCENRICKLFIWFKSRLKMPPNDTHFYGIIEKDEISKKLVDFRVIDDYLYRIEPDDEEEEKITTKYEC